MAHNAGTEPHVKRFRVQYSILLGIVIVLVASYFIIKSSGHDDPAKYHIYTNSSFHFTARVPVEWKLYGEIKNDSIKKLAIADWGLPKVFSQIESTDIENSISIRAYHSQKITSLEELILFEYLRNDPTQTALEVDSTSQDARIVYSTLNGLKYQGKIYFVFRNNTGYIITFMATPGTYHQNLPVFEEFRKNITFF